MIATAPIARNATVVTAWTLAGGAVAAVLARGTMSRGELQRWLGFRFDAPARIVADMLEIAATNLRLVAAVLLAALVVRQRPSLRALLDVALVGVLVLNAVTVGVALAAYGPRLIGSVALHAPLELAAFSLAGGAYLSARAGDLTTTALALTAVVAIALVCAGAVVETYLQVGGGQ